MDSTRTTLAAYFSHPWKTHTALSIVLWERLAGTCHLLLDRPIQKIHEKSPPYFINRIESLLQRSDVFVACLPFSDTTSTHPDESRSDWHLRCSPYILFEIRMAERVDLPRFIIYDPRSGFQPPESPGPHARYVPGRLNELSRRVELGAGITILDAIDEWKRWIETSVRPAIERDLFRCGILIAKDHSAVIGSVRDATRHAGFDHPLDLTGPYRNDAELIQSLRTLRLLVVDVSDSALLPIYQMAHTLLVPSIRLHVAPGPDSDQHLPAILRGHRAGYQNDLLRLNACDELKHDVSLRAAAVVEDATPIVGVEDGRTEIQRRSLKQHMVFLSHNLKPEQRALVESILSAFRERGLAFWEYEDRNQAGEDWRANLDQALQQMTHFVALESTTYDQSPMCVREMQLAKQREMQGLVEIRAFRVSERGSPTVELRNEGRTHQLLPESASAAALAITNNLLASIQR